MYIRKSQNVENKIINTEIKNLNLYGIGINVVDNKNISLKNLYIDVSKKDTYCISITEGVVKMKDIDLLSSTVGVKVNPGIVKINKSKVLLDGYLYNHYKTDNSTTEDNKPNYVPSIIVESKIISGEEVSKENVLIENEDINIEEMYNYKYTYDNEENKTKKIENYYKK